MNKTVFAVLAGSLIVLVIIYLAVLQSRVSGALAKVIPGMSRADVNNTFGLPDGLICSLGRDEPSDVYCFGVFNEMSVVVWYESGSVERAFSKWSY